MTQERGTMFIVIRRVLCAQAVGVTSSDSSLVPESGCFVMS